MIADLLAPGGHLLMLTGNSEDVEWWKTLKNHETTEGLFSHFARNGTSSLMGEFFFKSAVCISVILAKGIHLKILRLRMSLLHIMVVMDGWVGTCVTLSNGWGIYLGYVWIVWPLLVEDATIQAFVWHAEDVVSTCMADCSLSCSLVFLMALYGSRPPKMPRCCGLHFSDADTVWVKNTKKKHSIFYEVLGQSQTSLFKSIAPSNSDGIVVFCQLSTCLGKTSPTTSKTTSLYAGWLQFYAYLDTP